MKYNKILLSSLLFALLLAVLPFFAPSDPYLTRPEMAFRAPDSVHICGTDEVGRDIFSRMLYGARVTFFIGFASVFLSCLIGSVLGIIAGTYGGWIDIIAARIIDICLAFPSLLLAIGISIILPPGTVSVVVAITISGWASFARLVRSQAMIIKNTDYVLSAKALGSSTVKIMLYHILPNSVFLIIVSASMQLGSFMLAESGLSFLGLGIPAPYPTLGGMIAGGRDHLFSCPWIPLMPGILIALLVISSNFAGEYLNSILDSGTGKNQ